MIILLYLMAAVAAYIIDNHPDSLVHRHHLADDQIMFAGHKTSVISHFPVMDRPLFPEVIFKAQSKAVIPP